MAEVDTQFVRITFNNDFRVVTFYENQPIDELKDLLTALFPDVSSGRVVPVGIERPADNVVVPLSTGAKFPYIMTGDWELLCVPAHDIAQEKLVLLNFVKELFSQNYIGETQLKDLMMLVQEEDRPMLATYRSYLRHKDVRRLTSALIKLTTLRRAPLLGGEEARVANKLLALLKVMSDGKQITKTETRILADLIMAGDSVVYSAYDVAKISKDVDELMNLLKRIAEAKAGTVSTTAANNNNNNNNNSSTSNNSNANVKAARRDKVLETLSEYEYLTETELIVLANLESNDLLDDALYRYDNGGNIKDLLRDMQAIAHAELLRYDEEDETESDNSDYDMSRTARTVSQTSRNNSNNNNNNRDDIPPRPSSPTPYEDGKHAVVDKMLQEGIVDENGAQDLKRLIQENTPLIQTAFKLYETDDDLVDLRITLMRLLELENSRQALLEESEASSASALDDTIDYGLDDSVEDEETYQNIIRKAYDVVCTLADASLFSSQEKATLTALLRQDGTKEQDVIVSAYEVYEVDGDEDDFVDTCTRVVSHLNLRVAQDFALFDSVMANIVENEVIEDSEANQLSLLFRQGDARLSAAWDVFNETEDINEFIDTIKRISVRLQMDTDFQDTENTLQRINDDKKNNIGEVIAFMADQSMLTGKEMEMLVKLLDENDSIVTAAYDAFLSDHEFQDLVAALKMIAEQEVAMQNPLAVEQKFEQAQKEMSDLTDALRQQGDLKANEAEILQILINGDDPRLMGAYDVYASMQDVDDLVDSMKRIVNRVSSDAVEDSDEQYYNPGRKIYEGNDDDDDDDDDEDDFEDDGDDYLEGEEQDDEVEFSSNSSAFANDSHQAVKGWSQSESDPAPSQSEYSQTDSMDGYSEDFESYRSTEVDDISVKSVSKEDGILICIFQMQAEGFISKQSYELLMDYYQNDDRIIAAYDNYIINGSLEEFADTCKRIIEIVENESNEAAIFAEGIQRQISQERQEVALEAEKVQRQISQERDEAARAAEAVQQEIAREIDEIASAVDKYEEVLNDHMDKYADDIEKKSASQRKMDATLEFLSIIDDLELTIPEVSALESAVINGEPSVKACMKLYAQNKDRGDLQDTLKRIARQAVDDVVVEDIEEPSDFSSIMGRLAKKNVISTVEQRAFNDLWLDGNQIAMAALEVYELDEDESELIDTLRRVAHRAHA
jgi:hypothetical protein